MITLRFEIWEKIGINSDLHNDMITDTLEFMIGTGNLNTVLTYETMKIKIEMEFKLPEEQEDWESIVHHKNYREAMFRTNQMFHRHTENASEEVYEIVDELHKEFLRIIEEYKLKL
jgi:hypothetical protein